MFTTQEVADAAGISYRMVDYYLRLGRVRATDPTPGSGYRRLFGLDDAVHVATVAALVKAGLKASSAAEIAASGAASFETEDVQIAAKLRLIRERTTRLLTMKETP